MTKNMKIAATIEARMTSSRLPGKVLLPVNGKPLLSYLVERLKRVSKLDEIVLATTTNDSDDLLVEFAAKNKISLFRGSEEDVMSRVIGAGESVSTDIIVEITGDCPLIDPDLVEQAIDIYLNNTAKYVSNGHVRSYPDGMDVQVFALEDLRKSAAMTNDSLDHEHVTLHMRNHPEIFPPFHIISPPSTYWPELGLTLDEKNDYTLISEIIQALDDGSNSFSCLDIIKYLKQNPRLLNINKDVLRKGDT